MSKWGAGESTIVQRQSIDDIAHTEYRRICYEQPQICERVALLTRCESNCWLSVNFYRGREHGHFSEQDMNYLETIAPCWFKQCACTATLTCRPTRYPCC